MVAFLAHCTFLHMVTFFLNIGNALSLEKAHLLLFYSCCDLKLNILAAIPFQRFFSRSKELMCAFFSKTNHHFGKFLIQKKEIQDSYLTKSFLWSLINYLSSFEHFINHEASKGCFLCNAEDSKMDSFHIIWKWIEHLREFPYLGPIIAKVLTFNIKQGKSFQSNTGF